MALVCGCVLHAWCYSCVLRSLSCIKFWYLTYIMTFLHYVSVRLRRQSCVVVFLRLRWTWLVLHSICHNPYFGNFLRSLFLAPAFCFTSGSPSFESLTFLIGWVSMAATCTIVLGGNLNIPPDETSAHKIWSHFPELFEQLFVMASTDNYSV